MLKKWMLSTVIAATTVAGATGTSVLAFSDLEHVDGGSKIMELRDRGIVSGVGDNKFAPHERMTAPTAIALIVKAFEWTYDPEAPLASDVFDNVPDDAWYAEAMVAAHLNGIPIAADIDPDAPVTREQFVQWLMSAVYTTGDYAFIRMYVVLEDEADVSEGYMAMIQESILGNIVELGEDRKFRPTDAVTRAEAAGMVRNALEFVETHTPIPSLPEEDPIAAGEIMVRSTEVYDGIQLVTLSWGEKPHPGWSIRIEGIDFPEDAAAVVRYSLHYPDPAALYPQVMTTPEAHLYLDSSVTDIHYVLTGTMNKD